MFGTLIIILLVASVVALSAGFLVVALRMGKNFHQMDNQAMQPDPQRPRAGTRR